MENYFSSSFIYSNNMVDTQINTSDWNNLSIVSSGSSQIAYEIKWEKENQEIESIKKTQMKRKNKKTILKK